MNGSAPAVFRLQPWRYGLGIALAVATATLLIRGAFMVAVLAVGVSLDPWDFVDAARSALLTAAAGGVGGALVARQQPSWVKVSESGLEFQIRQHRAAFLPWAGVESARLRRAGPFTQLVVTPTGPDMASFAWTPGRMPRLHRGSFVIDVGMLTPGPSALVAEVNRHRAALPIA